MQTQTLQTAYTHIYTTGAKHIRIIIIFINCNWVVTRWQWLFYIDTKYEIGYY